MNDSKRLRQGKIRTVLTALFLSLCMCVPSYAGVQRRAASVSSEAGANGPSVGNSFWIFVSKGSKTLTLYKGKVPYETWPCNVGTNTTVHDKGQSGDSMTPSGTYYVGSRNDNSICYLALVISYPGVDDAKRGLENGLISQSEYDAIVTANENGTLPPQNTALGGLIEIHGEYHEGDTTHGCVAVDNHVMDILWPVCPVGTKIVLAP